MKDKKIPMVGGPLDGHQLEYVTRPPGYVDEAGNTMRTDRGQRMATEAAMGLDSDLGYILIDEPAYVHMERLHSYLIRRAAQLRRPAWLEKVRAPGA